MYNEIYQPNLEFDNLPQAPNYNNMSNIKNNRAIIIIPPSLFPDEVFAEINHLVVRNVYPQRYYISNYGRLWDALNNKFVALHFSRRFKEDGYNPGYLCTKIAIIKDNSLILKDVFIHRIVLTAFSYFPGCELYQVNHEDGDCANDRLYNLTWMTPKENVDHALENHLVQGKPIPKIELTVEQVEYVCSRIIQGYKDYEIFCESGILMSAINQIRSKRSYTEISSKFNLPEISIRRSADSLSEDEVKYICSLLEDGVTVYEICKILNVTRHIVNDIKFGRNYTNISCQYNILNKDPDYLPDEIVHKICRLIEAKYEVKEISNILGVNRTKVASIKQGASHTNISSLYNFQKKKQYAVNKITDEQVVEICKLLQAKQNTNQEIADKFGISSSVVRDIKLRYRFKHISKDFNW